MNSLTNSDYASILNYYKIPITSYMTNDNIKNKAENILASKLCKCIKKVDKKTDRKNKSESRAIAICRNAVIEKKGYEIYRFSCKNKPKLISKNNTKSKIVKRKYSGNKRLSRKKRV